MFLFYCWTGEVADLEALAVDDGGAGFIVFGFGDPHGLEGREGGQDGSTNPDRVFALWWGDDLDLHRRRGEGGDFLLHAIGDTRVHGGATGENVVGVEILTDVNVALHDRVVGSLVDTSRLHTNEGWLEKGFWATETFVTNGGHLSVGKFVRLFKGRGRSSGGHFLLKVEGDVAELFLDVTDDFTLGGGDEGVSTLSQDLHQVVGQVAAGQVQSHDGVWERITFVDRDVVGNTITGVEDDTGSTARGVEGEHRLNAHVHGRYVEGFEHDLGHFFAVGLGVERRFGEEDGMLFWRSAELVVEGVVPDLFHVVPVGNDTVLNRVFEGQDTTLGLSFIAHVRVLGTHADHDPLVTGAADDGGVDGARSIVTGETGLHKTRTVVAH